MEEKNKLPLLLEFLFGEAAETTQRVVSERLMRWCRAFDEWLEERRNNFKPSTHKQSLQTWRRLLRERNKIPWELEKEDIEQHVEWMMAEGYAASTIYNAVGMIANFYRWCDERRIDPECEPGFNPAAGVKRPKVKRYDQAQLLSRGEIKALLSILERDDSALGKRDHAFILAQLRMGVPLRALQQLQWGQIELEKGGLPGQVSRKPVLDRTDQGDAGLSKDRLRDEAWVRWRPETARTPLPKEVWEVPQWELRDKLGTAPHEAGQAPLERAGQAPLERAGQGWGKMPREVWEAIRAYLTASGRLAGIREGDYIFAPLAEPGNGRENDLAEDWVRERHISNSQILASLKLYGRVVKIPEEKLTLQTLRRTTVRLRLDEVDSIEEIKVFLNSQEGAKFTKYRLGKLPQLPEEGCMGEMIEGEAQVPDRRGKPFKPGEGIRHGYYAKSQPEEEVLAVLAEDIQGIEEEIAGLRKLAWGLVVRQKEARTSKEAMQLADTHTLAASQVAELMGAEKQLAKEGKGSSWTEDLLSMLDKAAVAWGEEPVNEGIRAEARGGEDELGMIAFSLVEEIATMRHMLRNVLAWALESEDVEEYMRLVQIYGSGCLRLVRVLKRERGDHNRLERCLEEGIDQAIDEVSWEWGRKASARH